MVSPPLARAVGRALARGQRPCAEREREGGRKEREGEGADGWVREAPRRPGALARARARRGPSPPPPPRGGERPATKATHRPRSTRSSGRGPSHAERAAAGQWGERPTGPPSAARFCRRGSSRTHVFRPSPFPFTAGPGVVGSGFGHEPVAIGVPRDTRSIKRRRLRV